MPVTTIKRCQSHRDWWYTVEDCNVECAPDSGTGLTIMYFDQRLKEGKQLIAANKEDALLIRAALAEPEPEGPTPSDEELMDLAAAVFDDPFATDNDYARAVLARWGK